MNISTLIEEAQRHEEDQAWTEALETYRQALALDPTNAQIHNSLGIVYEKLGQLDRVEQHYRASLQLDPNAAYAHYNLGTLYKEQGRMDEAQAELERFLSLADGFEEIAEAKELLTEISGLSFEKCRKCGSISTLESFFKYTYYEGLLCPRCYTQSRSKRLARRLGIIGGSSLALALLSHPFLPPLHYILVNVLLVLTLNFFLIIPRELCHVVVTWLARGKAFEVRMGRGPVVWEKHIEELLLSFGKYPFLGLYLAAFPTRVYVRVRWLLVISSGVLFNVSMLLLFAPGYVGSHLGATYAFRETFVIANALHLLFSLLPRKVTLGNIETGTDGFQLLQLFSGKLSADVAHLAYFLYEGVYTLKRKAYVQAIEACEAGLALYPDSTLLKNVKASALLDLGQHAEALVLYQDLLARLEAPQPVEEPGITDANRTLMKAALLNNVAYATLLNSPKLEALEQAYDHARQAFRMAPWMASFQGTLGAVLVETGRVEEGIEHLLEAHEYHESTENKATVLAHAAIGYQRLGNTEKATALLQKAEALDASAYMVKKAQAELQKTGYEEDV